jgi:hypothetical protein
MVIAEIELGGVTVQMGFGNVMVDADNSAFQDREIIFDGIGMPEMGADVFLGTVVDGAMPAKFVADAWVNQALIRHQVGSAVDLGDNDRAQRGSADMRDMEGANRAVALNKRQHGGLGRNLVFAIARLAADVGLVDFDDLVLTAESAGQLAFAHCLANAVHHEPGGLIAAAHHALHLERRHALLAAVEQIDRHAPLVQRDFGALADGVDRDGELLAAIIALKQAGPMRFAVQSRDRHCTAMRAERTIGPNPCLKPLARRVVVMKNWVVEMAGHVRRSCPDISNLSGDRCFVNGIIAASVVATLRNEDMRT